MSRPSEIQINSAARALTMAMKRWKLIGSGNEHLVFEFPANGPISPVDGEPCKFWRFNDKRQAEDFRDRKVLESILGSLRANELY